MTFGEFLKKCREERLLSLRDLAKLSDVDHAYIYRLEMGEKADPSKESIRALATALRVTGRRLMVFKLLAERKDLPSDLVAVALDEAVNADETVLYSVAGMKFRGKQPRSRDDWVRLIRDVGKILERSS